VTNLNHLVMKLSTMKVNMWAHMMGKDGSYLKLRSIAFAF